MILAAIVIALTAVFSTVLPNPSLTPGETDAAVTQAKIKTTICQSGYTDRARQTTLATEKQVFARYHIDWSTHAHYEVDHLISLELGGADTLRNLWPQPYCPPKSEHVPGCYGAREKDVVETTFKRRICNGQMTLRDAQKRIAKDWLAEYHRIEGGR